MSIYKEASGEITNKQAPAYQETQQKFVQPRTQKGQNPFDFDLKKAAKCSRHPGASVRLRTKTLLKKSLKKASSANVENTTNLVHVPIMFPYEEFIEESTSMDIHSSIKNGVHIRQCTAFSTTPEEHNLSEMHDTFSDSSEALEELYTSSSEENLNQVYQDPATLLDNETLSSEQLKGSLIDGTNGDTDLNITQKSHLHPSIEMYDESLLEENFTEKTSSLEQEDAFDIDSEQQKEISHKEKIKKSQDQKFESGIAMPTSLPEPSNNLMHLEPVVFTTPQERSASIAELSSLIEKAQVQMQDQASISIDLPIQGKDASMRLTITTHRYAPKQYNIQIEGLPSELLIFALQNRTALLEELSLRGICVHQLLLSEMKDPSLGSEASPEHQSNAKLHKHGYVGKVVGSNFTRH